MRIFCMIILSIIKNKYWIGKYNFLIFISFHSYEIRLPTISPTLLAPSDKLQAPPKPQAPPHSLTPHSLKGPAKDLVGILKRDWSCCSAPYLSLPLSVSPIFQVQVPCDHRWVMSTRPAGFSFANAHVNKRSLPLVMYG